MQLAAEIGVDPNDVNYVSYDGGGPLTSALLGEKIDVGFSGLAEFVGQIESGELRVLAVSGEERYPDGPLADIPTLTEDDIDLVFLNWRGVLAPPEISDERTDELIGYLQTMHDSQGWQAQLAEKGWTDDFKTGDDFAAFIDEQDATGVGDPPGAGAAMSQATERPGTSEPPDRREDDVDKSQYLLAAGLFLVGIYTIIDARGLTVGFGDPVGRGCSPT